MDTFYYPLSGSQKTRQSSNLWKQIDLKTLFLRLFRVVPGEQANSSLHGYCFGDSIYENRLVGPGSFVNQRQRTNKLLDVSTLLFFNLQVQDDVFAAVKVRYRARLRLRALFFRVKFVVGIRIKAAEAVVARLVRIIAAN